MKKPLFARIFAGYLFVALLLAALILGLSFHTIRAFYLATLTDDLSRLGTTLNERITPLLESGDYGALDHFLKNLDIRIHRRITIVDVHGVVLADSENDPARMDNHRSRPEIVAALAGTTGTAMRDSATAGQALLYVALPIVSHGTVTGALRISMPVKDINVLLGGLKGSIVHLTLAVILVALIIAFFFSRNLSRPLLLLAGAARQFAAGKFSTRVTIESNDELQELADNFNRMAEQLQSSFADISGQRGELQAIISSLQSSLFVIDKDDRILMSNARFIKLAGGQQVDGRYYWEFIRAPRLRELLEQAKTSMSAVSAEIDIDASTYLCSITAILSVRREYVITLHDITPLKNLEKIKKDFVGNVSHELRTPLTAIKGYVETLEGTVDAESKQYLEIVKRHTDRLIRIVEDLLTLSEMEDKGFTVETGRIDLRELIDHVMPVFSQRLKDSNLEMSVNIENGLPSITGDRFRLEQMFINLIDNAIKYTDKGRISISAAVKGSSLIIEVADTGIGIPAEHLSRIFERFYVVDKSRSRKSGGTGLGLAIVKHIVLLHHGQIEALGTPGAGTTFRITLPLPSSAA